MGLTPSVYCFLKTVHTGSFEVDLGVNAAKPYCSINWDSSRTNPSAETCAKGSAPCQQYSNFINYVAKNCSTSLNEKNFMEAIIAALDSIFVEN